jgi:hypothetical protein
LPYGPLLLAVSDESFDFEATLNVPQKGGFAGLCVYHLDSTYAAVGLNREAMEIHTTIAGSHNRSIIARTFECEEVTWLLRRSLSHLDIGYRRGEDEAIWVGSFQLPGLEKSISFGLTLPTKPIIPCQAGCIQYVQQRELTSTFKRCSYATMSYLQTSPFGRA